jgi:hypothetical protein
MMRSLEEMLTVGMVYSIIGSPAASAVVGAAAGYSFAKDPFTGTQLALLAGGIAVPAAAYGWFGYMWPHGSARNGAQLGATFAAVAETIGFAAGYTAGKLL